MNVIAKPPFKKVDFLPRDIEVERRPDGVVILRSRHKLMPYERHIPAYLARWARERPDRVWLAQRRGPQRQWLQITYEEAKRQVDALTQALLNRGLDQTRPVMILSGNSIEHALLAMAAMQAQVPAAPVSQAYSLMSQDHGKLKYVFELLDPGLVMVQNGPPFERALKALDLSRCEVVHVEAPPEGIKSTAFAELLATNPGPEVERSIAGIGPRTIGKFLFTSGSTGMPKAVINTQEMMCANVVMGRQVRPRRPEDPIPVVLDWLPWNHTMGGNASFHGLLADGGTVYIDDGKPIPGMFEETLRNLREVSPTYYSNVPAGYAALAAALEKDEALCRTFFKQLGSLAYGGATLPDDLYERMQALAVKYTGHRLLFGTGWGSTETAPTATATYWETERVGLIGLPFPGVELKMVPAGSKYELRLRGITITPGYYKQPELTAQMFDEEGFYKIGDAGDFVDPADPAQGLVFKGRVVEDFKLSSGTFVHVGSLRVAVIAAATPVVQDAIIAGQDKDYVAIMAWPSILACRQLVGDEKMPVEELVRQPKVIETLRAGLRKHNAENPGSSFQVRRALFLTEPASIDGNELTDKGYINQRATLERRAALVEALYAEPPGSDVIVI
ncbi:MAG: AMP-binding protein [Reyranellaceae bacterium]